jgi:FHA domain
MIIVLFLGAVGVVAYLWWRAGGASTLAPPSPTPTPSRLTPRNGSVIGGIAAAARPARPVTVVEVQSKALKVFNTLLVQTIGEKGFISGSAVRIWISPEAWNTIRPFRSKIEHELEVEILHRSQAQGWVVPPNLSVLLAIDETLTRLEMRGESLLDDITSPAGVAGGPERPDEDPERTVLTLPRLVNLADLTEHVLNADTQVVVGRSTQVSDWVIADEYLSAAHAVFEAKPTASGWEISVYDRDSTNGTRVDDGRELKPRTLHLLREGAVISLGPQVKLQLLLIA